MTSTSHRFGRFELRPSQRCLLADGLAVPLGTRAFDVLLALIERRERVVGSGELFELAWPGVVVEENNLRQQVAALRKLLGADAVLTVAGRGYRFGWPLSSGDAMAAAPVGEVTEAPALRSERPSIAILPFAVLSEDRRLGFLADGLVEDVIALLARVPGFMLISRSSSFEFRRRSESVSSIARELGVRYIVEGSARSVGPRVRVSTQLIDAASGQVLWSGSVDSDWDETADLQEVIARGIIAELEPELNRAEIQLIRRQRPDNVDAWGHYQQAVAAIATQGWTEAALGEARAQFRHAMAVDRSFGLASAHFGLITALGLSTGLLQTSDALAAEAFEAVEHALSLDDGDPHVLGYAGCALADLGHVDRGVAILERALAIDPSNAQAHVALGATQALRGDKEGGIEKMRYGMRISPRDRRLGFWGWFVGLSLLSAGRADEALHEARASASRDPRLYLSRVLEAGVLLSLGRRAEASEAFAAARRLRPLLTPKEVMQSQGKAFARLVEPLWGPA